MSPPPETHSPIRDHRRQWRQCLYVYPVVSRRSKGLSIGVNLNIDKQCSFACVYCQINRRIQRENFRLDVAILHDELHLALEEALTGRIWNEPPFAHTPRELRRVNDIAFSGDGEPTCVEAFDQAVAAAAQALRDIDLPGAADVKLVVITNGSALAAPQVQRALPYLDEFHGEIWVKLDAGTEDAFQRINRPAADITLARIVDDATAIARERPIVIQSLFFRTDGGRPPDDQIRAYCDRVREILDGGGQVKLIQAHTIARPPAESSASPLSDAELDAITTVIRATLPHVPVEVFYGQDVPPQPAE